MKSGVVWPKILPYASEVGRIELENCFQNHLRGLGSQNVLRPILCPPSVATNTHEKRWWKLSQGKHDEIRSYMSWSNFIQKWGLHASIKLHPRRGFDSPIKHFECCQDAVQLHAPDAVYFQPQRMGFIFRWRHVILCVHMEKSICELCNSAPISQWVSSQ